MAWTAAELRLLALGDQVTDWNDDAAYKERARERMAKARAARAILAAQNRDRRRVALESKRAEIVARTPVQRAGNRPRMDGGLSWIDRTLLARLPATLSQLVEHLRSLDATKLPRVVEDRMQRLETMGMARQEAFQGGNGAESVSRWTPI